MPKLDRLTSLRGLAALYVVLFHCQIFIPGFDLRPWTGLLDKGYLAVDFFFVLSGFILGYVYAPHFDGGRGPYRRFLFLRLARVGPVHLAMLFAAAMLILPIYGFGEVANMTNTPRTLASSALLLHAWGGDPGLSWNFPSWSISAEWFAYLLFPVALRVSSRLAARPLAALAAAIALVLALGAVARILLRPGVTVGNVILASHALPTMPFDLTYDFALVRVAFEFLSGVFLYRAFAAWRGRPGRWAGFAATTVALTLLVLLHVVWPAKWFVQDTLAVTGAAALILFVALDRSVAGRCLEWRPLVYLGEASYSIYMTHGLVLWVFVIASIGWTGLRSPDLAIGATVAAACTATAVASGVAVYAWFEAPVRARSRAWLERGV